MAFFLEIQCNHFPSKLQANSESDQGLASEHTKHLSRLYEFLTVTGKSSIQVHLTRRRHHEKGLAYFHRISTRLQAKYLFILNPITSLLITLEHRGSLLGVRSPHLLQDLLARVHSLNGQLRHSSFTLWVGAEGQLTIGTRGVTRHPLVLLAVQAEKYVRPLMQGLLVSANIIGISQLKDCFDSNGGCALLNPKSYIPPLIGHSELLSTSQTTSQIVLQTLQSPPEPQKPKQVSNLQQSLQGFYSFLHRQFEEKVLYSAPLLPLNPLSTLQKIMNEVASFPKDRSTNFIFNTIKVVSHNKQQERVIFQGGKSDLLLSSHTFKYTFSSDFNSLGSSLESCAQPPSIDFQTLTFTKDFLVKIPKGKSSHNSQYARSLIGIHYQKEILKNMRTATSSYLPRYYQANQPDYEYRSYFMVDYVKGRNLFEEMAQRSRSMGSSSKCYLLYHLTNGLRFLSGKAITHLDLNPNNILVTNEMGIKIVDFGQSYHQKTTGEFCSRIRKEMNTRFVYSPGRTHPFAPPETSLRNKDFSTQQDIYSLGLIIYYIFFGSFLLPLSEATLQGLFSRGDYLERLLLAPERVDMFCFQAVGRVILSLVLRMITEEGKRAQLGWIFIIIRRLFAFCK